VHPLLRLGLTLASSAPLSIRLQSWTPRTASMSVVSVIDSLASVVSITAPRTAAPVGTAPVSTAPTATGTVHLYVGSVTEVVDQVDRLLDRTRAEPVSVPALTFTVGLTESQAVITALQRGDHDAARQIVTVPNAPELFRLLVSLATCIEVGARVRAYERGLPRFSADWVQSATGEWVSLRLVNPHAGGGRDARADESPITAQNIVDDGCVQLAQRHRSTLLADITSLMFQQTVETAHV